MNRRGFIKSLGLAVAPALFLPKVIEKFHWKDGGCIVPVRLYDGMAYYCGEDFDPKSYRQFQNVHGQDFLRLDCFDPKTYTGEFEGFKHHA